MNKFFFLLLTCIAAQASLHASQKTQCKSLGNLHILDRNPEIRSISKQTTELAETYCAVLASGNTVHAEYYLAEPQKDTISCVHYVSVFGGGINIDQYDLDKKYYHILKAIYDKAQEEQTTANKTEENKQSTKE